MKKNPSNHHRKSIPGIRCLLIPLAFGFGFYAGLAIAADTWYRHEYDAHLVDGPRTPSLHGIVPKLLPLEDRSKEHLFVHIGKAGGSSIQVMARKARSTCEELTNNQTKNDLLKSEVCVLATIPDGRVHLGDRLAPKRFYGLYQQFLVNVRDPIDRLASWYNYELIAFKKEPRWSTADKSGEPSDNFKRLSRKCFPGKDGFAAMVKSGMLLASASERKIDQKTITSGAGLTCNQLARACLRGDIMCYGHNFYNYEVYLEELLRRKGLATNSRGAETLRIDVIRSEYSVDDFDRIVGLWTSDDEKELEGYTGATPYVRSLYGNVRSTKTYGPKKKRVSKENQEVLSPKARSALCKHICQELIVYKTILRAADNLYSSEIRESYRALDDKCGFRVDDVCGTSWTYRDIKKKKKVFEQPW
jgi:hypothetical protein